MKRSHRPEPQGRPLRPLKTLLAAALLGLGALQAQADTLWDIYTQALDNDQQLAADRAGYHAGIEAKNQFRAALLPQVNAAVRAARVHTDNSNNGSTLVDRFATPPDIVDFFLRSTGTTQDRTYNATLSQAIFNAPAWFDYQQGKKLTEQATAEFSANQQGMMIRVATAYFDVLRAYDVLEAAIAEEQALAKQLEQTQQRFEVGLTAITDVYDSQAAYDSSVARRLTAQDDLLSDFDALSVLTGGYHDAVAPLNAGFQVAAPVPAERADWVEFALANNFELKAARLNAEAARYNARSAASEHLPTLTGTLSYNKFTSNGEIREKYRDFRGEAVTNFPLDLDNRDTTAAITLDIPIYTGGLLSANRRQARNQSFQAQDLRNLTERNTIQTTRTLHRVVVTDVSRVSARQQAVVSAKSALDATQAGYEVGTRNIVDVLLAQRTLFQSQTDYANALYDYILNTLNLKQVAGLLSPKDLQELDAMLNPARTVPRVAEPNPTRPPASSR
ncbi:TolC family outer membrane protein [Microbulbifer sp. 2205BS26-8]|uniref:TolC family outer membrane protein n=1 Tax=Microbulbifer sp. 2205BS26-8 TaxID=3064386 RepID=UPI00273D30D0|nr:TolC family outer membrane protein [Microbulbifer sp. 2205BS26-8]MDP5208491.1 TolC family outer membrane protein [Microbulbifer sp. 2205BS26-8]